MSGGVPAGEIAKERADWLLDAVATATQDRRYLRGDPEYDEWAGEAILLNGEKAIRVAIDRASPTPPIEGRDADVERVEIVAKAIYDATHVGLSNCYAWDDEWEPYQEARRGRYYKEAAAAIAALQALGERG